MVGEWRREGYIRPRARQGMHNHPNGYKPATPLHHIIPQPDPTEAPQARKYTLTAPYIIYHANMHTILPTTTRQTLARSHINVVVPHIHTHMHFCVSVCACIQHIQASNACLHTTCIAFPYIYWSIYVSYWWVYMGMQCRWFAVQEMWTLLSYGNIRIPQFSEMLAEVICKFYFRRLNSLLYERTKE